MPVDWEGTPRKMSKQLLVVLCNFFWLTGCKVATLASSSNTPSKREGLPEEA